MYIIKVNKDYDYIPILMAKGFCSQIDGVLHIDRHVPLSEDDPERIAPTITTHLICRFAQGIPKRCATIAVY